FQIASAESRPVPAPSRIAKPVNLASLSPNDIISARGYWQGLPEIATDGRAPRSAANDVTASTTPFQRNDRVPSDVALAYAAQIDNTAAVEPALVTIRGAATVAVKPPEPGASK